MTNISVCRQLFAVISLLVIHLLVVFEENLVSVESTRTQRKHSKIKSHCCYHWACMQEGGRI
ncbi:hypothetical protein T01_7303 [Trichinella spiralis]|uniref:Uncharacterized protein n=1 Tax=Trichinella spiralis TaxID=6334 RepID=A0A0V1BZI1_TRISP|nr:hypothetical protein T01_7303 [Trichinella spiralis]